MEEKAQIVTDREGEVAMGQNFFSGLSYWSPQKAL
jgi:hypothetical protein